MPVPAAVLLKATAVVVTPTTSAPPLRLRTVRLCDALRIGMLGKSNVSGEVGKCASERVVQRGG